MSIHVVRRTRDIVGIPIKPGVDAAPSQAVPLYGAGVLGSVEGGVLYMGMAGLPRTVNINDNLGLTDNVVVEPRPVITDNEGLTEGGPTVPPVFRALTPILSAAGFLGTNFPISINVPAGTQSGDQLIAVIVQTGTLILTADSPVTPAGWVLASQQAWSIPGNIGTNVWIYTRTATGAEPAFYTWASSGGPISGAVTYTMFGYSGVGAVTIGNIAPASLTAPSINAPAQSYVLYLGWAFPTGIAGVWTDPVGYTQRGSQSGVVSGLAMLVDDIASVANGETGTVTASVTGASTRFGSLLIDLAGIRSAVTPFVDIGVNLNDNEGLTDTISPALATSINDNEGLTDTLSAEPRPVITDNEGLTDNETAAIGTTINDNEGLTDNEAAEIGQTITDNEGLSDNVSAEPQPTITDPEGLTDDAALEIGVNLSDDLGLTDTLAGELAALLVDQLGLTDNTAGELSTFITDTLGMTDTLATEAGVVIVDNEGLTDQLEADHTYEVTITDDLGLTDDLIVEIFEGEVGCLVITFAGASVAISFDAPTVDISFTAPTVSISFEDCT